MKKIIGVTAIVTLMLIASSRGDTTIDPTSHYAWGANIGFTGWRPSTVDGVNIGDNFCSGFIYAANVGWIKIGAGTPANGIRNTSASHEHSFAFFLLSPVPGDHHAPNPAPSDDFRPRGS